MCPSALLRLPVQMTTAARSAFLIQASTLFTPLLAACAGMPASRLVQGGQGPGQGQGMETVSVWQGTEQRLCNRGWLN